MLFVEIAEEALPFLLFFIIMELQEKMLFCQIAVRGGLV